MKTFEYLKVLNPNDKRLDELGEKGWELIQIITPYKVQHFAGTDINTDLAYIFKRTTYVR